MATLTELQIRAAKPAAKAYKLYDERGLFMLVTPPVDVYGVSSTAMVG